MIFLVIHYTSHYLITKPINISIGIKELISVYYNVYIIEDSLFMWYFEEAKF